MVVLFVKCLPYLICFCIGAFVGYLFGGKTVLFTQREVALITSKIEALKATDINKYNALISEWNEFLTDEKGKVLNISTALKSIVTEIKAI